MAKENASKVNPDNYIVVQGWMVKDLKLKGNALLVYAAIWGFSQGDNQFTGSMQYLADWTNSTKEGVRKVLNKLVDDGLLIKEDVFINNAKNCKYTAAKKLDSIQQNCTPTQQSCIGGIQQSCIPTQQSCIGGIQQSCIPMQQSCIGGIQQSWSNNININNIEDNLGIDNIANKKKASKSKKNKAENEKEVKSIDDVLNLLKNEELKNAFKEFIKMRNKMKKPLTPYALELAIKDLFKLSEDKEEMVAIVNQSIQNSWLGLFPLRHNSSFQQNKQNFNNEFLSLLNEGGF